VGRILAPTSRRQNLLDPCAAAVSTSLRAAAISVAVKSCSPKAAPPRHRGELRRRELEAGTSTPVGARSAARCRRLTRRAPSRVTATPPNRYVGVAEQSEEKEGRRRGRTRGEAGDAASARWEEGGGRWG
jgi:hypothetical protein